jgi:hypothetical protein
MNTLENSLKERLLFHLHQHTYQDAFNANIEHTIHDNLDKLVAIAIEDEELLSAIDASLEESIRVLLLNLS